MSVSSVCGVVGGIFRLLGQASLIMCLLSYRQRTRLQYCDDDIIFWWSVVDVTSMIRHDFMQRRRYRESTVIMLDQKETQEIVGF